MSLTMKQVRHILRRRYEAQKTGNVPEVEKTEAELTAAGVDKIVDYIGEVGLKFKAGSLKDWDYDRFEMVSLNKLYSME